ncbi:DUF7261 family protein [Halodesulfurarchaeum sp.]|uniref:DUF7261 family protein n=1 Tax=Halodesulfurarchaeum sp. TaxID=1980530 RepID=UPI001BC37D7E|nr:hypothetical protein [Halodesulfurarchaeum sp.]
MGRSRGQIILVAAFALALIFVSLALILNTAIFTENLATRETADGHDALDLQQAVAETGDVLLRKTNRGGGTKTELTETYRDRIENYSDIENVHAVARGSIRDIFVRQTHNGTYINQSNNGTLEDDDGNSTWQVTADTTDVRAMTFNMSAAESGTPFELNATNGSSTWTLSVNESSDTFFVTLNDFSGNSVEENFTEDTLEIQPTNGSIDGERWPELQFQDAFEGPFEMWISNGSNASGTYQMTVDTPEDDIDNDGYDQSNDPHKTDAIYNATLGLELFREDLEYRANVTIEPEGPDPRQ